MKLGEIQEQFSSELFRNLSIVSDKQPPWNENQIIS